MYLLKKMDVVHAIKPLPSDVIKAIRKINAVRNAFAHSLFPENRKEHRKNKQVLYGDTYPHSRRFKKLLGRLSPRVQLSGTPLWQTGGTPPSLKRTPSASSAERTRFKARALALGTLPLEPSQAVRQGREIEARSASSCCERPVRLRAARNMPPVISTIVMLRLFARRQRASMSVYFTNSLTPPARLGLLASPCGWFPGRAARGSVAPRKVVCRPAAGGLA